MPSSNVCKGQADCGENAMCSYERKLCECLPKFTINVNNFNRTCGKFINFGIFISFVYYKILF